MVSDSTYSFRHANTCVPNCHGLSFLVWDDIDSEVFLRVELARVCEGFIANFVKSIGRVGDQFTQENLLVRVDSVDDEGKKLRNFSLKFESSATVSFDIQLAEHFRGQTYSLGMFAVLKRLSSFLGSFQ